MDTSFPIITLIADKPTPLRKALVHTLQVNRDIVVADVTDNETALLQLCNTHRPSVVIISTNLYHNDDCNIAACIGKKYPHIHIILFIPHADDAAARAVTTSPAAALMYANSSDEEIIATVLNTDGAHNFASMAHRYGLHAENETGLPGLFKEEERLLPYICKDYSAKEIAAVLGKTTKTIEKQRSALLKKINARGNAGVLLFAQVRKLLSWISLLFLMLPDEIPDLSDLIDLT